MRGRVKIHVDHKLREPVRKCIFGKAAGETRFAEHSSRVQPTNAPKGSKATRNIALWSTTPAIGKNISCTLTPGACGKDIRSRCRTELDLPIRWRGPAGRTASRGDGR